MEDKKKILIADDDLGILDSLCILLELEGYDVHCTSDGNELLSMDGSYPDVILLDVWMSGVDGRDICRQLKQRPATKNLPIIMISASNEIEASVRAAGADSFIPKPFDINILLETIRKNMVQ